MRRGKWFEMFEGRNTNSQCLTVVCSSAIQQKPSMLVYPVGLRTCFLFFPVRELQTLAPHKPQSDFFVILNSALTLASSMPVNTPSRVLYVCASMAWLAGYRKRQISILPCPVPENSHIQSTRPGVVETYLAIYRCGRVGENNLVTVKE